MPGIQLLVSGTRACRAAREHLTMLTMSHNTEIWSHRYDLSLVDLKYTSGIMGFNQTNCIDYALIERD